MAWVCFGDSGGDQKQPAGLETQYGWLGGRLAKQA